MFPAGTASRSSAVTWTSSRFDGGSGSGVRHVLVEDLFGDRHQAGMRHPGAVVPGLHFAQLVLPDLFERLLIGLRIVLDRNLRGHAAHGVNAAAVAGLDQQVARRSCRKWRSIVTWARSGSTKSGRLRNFLMKLKM